MRRALSHPHAPRGLIALALALITLSEEPTLSAEARPLAPLTLRDVKGLERARERLERALRNTLYQLPTPRALEEIERQITEIERLATRFHQASSPTAERPAALRAWRVMEGLLNEERGPFVRFEGRFCVRPYIRANLGGAWAHHGQLTRALHHFSLAAACTHAPRTHWQAAVEVASRSPDPALRAAAAARLETLSPALTPQEQEPPLDAAPAPP